MVVYVDQLLGHGTSSTWRHTHSCHLFSDTEVELDAMADKIGLKRQWKQTKAGYPPHYDLTGSKRRLAVSLGAHEVTWREYGRWMREKRKEMQEAGLPVLRGAGRD